MRGQPREQVRRQELVLHRAATQRAAGQAVQRKVLCIMESVVATSAKPSVCWVNRWYNHLNPVINKDPWLPEEDALITQVAPSPGCPARGLTL